MTWDFQYPPLYFLLALILSPLSIDSDHGAARVADFRNRLAEVMFEPLGVPILRVANATRTEWHAHVGLQVRHPPNSKGTTT